MIPLLEIDYEEEYTGTPRPHDLAEFELGFPNSKELHCSPVKAFFSGNESKDAETKRSISRFSDILLLENYLITALIN